MDNQPKNPEAVERPVNKRHEVMKELAQAHDERAAQEAKGVGETVEFEPAPRDEPVAKQEESSPAATQQAETVTPEAPAAEQPRTPDGKFATTAEPAVTTPQAAPEMVTVKIDGETLQVPKSEVDAVGSVALYQIEKTSAKRLKQINAEKAEFAAWAAQQRQALSQPQVQQQPQQPAPNQDEVLKALNEQLIYGDEAQRIAATKQLVAMAQQPQQQINATVQQQVYMALNVQKLTEAENQFVNRNRDLLLDAEGQPNLAVVDAAKARVDRMKQQIVQTGQFPANPDEFFKALEGDMRKVFGKPAVASDVTSRIEKKVAIAEPKTASGRVPPPAETKQLTVSEQIDQMRKARGQKQLYH